MTQTNRADTRDLDAMRDAAWPHVSATPGYLSLREARFLMLAAARTPAEGAVLEIGSFKGRSTVALAYTLRHYGLGRVIAVDPHTSPSTTDPGVAPGGTSFDEFEASLERVGLRGLVDAHRQFSRDLARTYSGPIRFLWIDGDHTLEGAREDVVLFTPHLAPRGVVAMHDVLGTFPGSLRVFIEDILGSDDYGPAGFCGSIGWAQYLPGGGGAAYRRSRAWLAWRLRQLLPVAESGRGLVGWNKYRYKLWRATVPHGEVDAERWTRAVTRGVAPSR